ncbi:hypothetical protein ACFL2Q_20205 [Thermodesulfobacteriota bacterium]
MSERHIRPTNDNKVVVVATEMYHEYGVNRGRRCHKCNDLWTVQREANGDFHVYRNGQSEDEAILDWVGNNVAMECCNPNE